MKESHDEGLATHIGPESCATAREGGGRSVDRGTCRPAIEPRKRLSLLGADAVKGCGKAIPEIALSQAIDGPGAVEDPAHARKHSAREPGDPAIVWGARCPDRIGKSKDASR